MSCVIIDEWDFYRSANTACVVLQLVSSKCLPACEFRRVIT